MNSLRVISQIFSLAVALVYSLETTAQATKKVVVEHQNPFYTEEYYVLESDPKIKHGPYLKRSLTYLQETGFFNYGMKDSVWSYFDNSEKKLLARGTFHHDKKAGVWEYFSMQDYSLDHRYDHSLNELVYLRPSRVDTVKFYAIISGHDTMTSKLDRPLYYIGGLENVSLAVAENIGASNWYQTFASVNPEDGMIRVVVWIDSLGNASPPFIATSVHKKLDKIVL
jgi:hypothetical protein